MRLPQQGLELFNFKPEEPSLRQIGHLHRIGPGKRFLKTDGLVTFEIVVGVLHHEWDEQLVLRPNLYSKRSRTAQHRHCLRYQIGIDHKVIVWRRLRHQMPNIRFNSAFDIVLFLTRIFTAITHVMSASFNFVFVSTMPYFE